jgi:hypothetical protein
MGVVATGLLIGGIWYFLSAAEGNRERLESEYSRAVQRWQEAKRYFSTLVVSASTRTHPAFESEQLVTLEADSTPDKLYDSENAFNLPSYETLSFVHHGVPPGFMPPADFESLQTEDAKQSRQKRLPQQLYLGPLVTLAMKLEDDSGLGGTVLRTQPFPVVRALLRHAPTPAPELKCRRELSGLYKAGMCWIFSKLARVCVQVSRDPATRLWRLAPRRQGRNESYGCDYASGEWAVPHYERVPASHARGSVYLDNVTIQVRSADDPYLSALDITDGALDFGMSASDNRAVGFVMILLGLVIACPPFYAAYKASTRSRSARSLTYATMGGQRYHRDDEDNEMYGVDSYEGFESEGFDMR